MKPGSLHVCSTRKKINNVYFSLFQRASQHTKKNTTQYKHLRKQVSHTSIMVVLDLNLVRNHGLGSRQSSYIGAGDSWSTTGTFKTQDDEDEKEEQARKDAVIKNATHLYLQSRSIHKISPSINKLINLKVIYLYDNKLVTIHALAHAVNLTHVYLQGNTISTTSGLSKLKKLEKLYLANNKIEVIEDLCNTDGEGSLQELHIENQELPTGMPLVFEPEALESLRFTIRIINISGNNIQTVDNILQTCHRTLQKIDASNNRIKSLNTMNEDGGQVRFPYLKQIIFKNNPLQQKSGTKKYRQGLVTKFESLKELDGNEISAFERKWHLAFQEKEFNKLHQQAQDKLAATQEQQFQSMNSITDLIPPVPDHWRSRGLPGARHQFDQVQSGSDLCEQSDVSNKQNSLTFYPFIFHFNFNETTFFHSLKPAPTPTNVLMLRLLQLNSWRANKLCTKNHNYEITFKQFKVKNSWATSEHHSASVSKH